MNKPSNGWTTLWKRNGRSLLRSRLLFLSLASLFRLFLWPDLFFLFFFSSILLFFYSIFFDCWISARGDEDVDETMDALTSTSTMHTTIHRLPIMSIVTNGYKFLDGWYFAALLYLFCSLVAGLGGRMHSDPDDLTRVGTPRTPKTIFLLSFAAHLWKMFFCFCGIFHECCSSSSSSTLF